LNHRYTKIYSTYGAFAAVKADGAITAWGYPHAGGIGAPPGSGYTKIYSTVSAFAALKTNGSITVYLIGCRGKSSNIQITPHRDCSVSFNGGKSTPS
jgi:hypothetical protein